MLTIFFVLFFIFILYYSDPEREPFKYVFWTLITGFLAAVIERFIVRYFVLKLLPIRDIEFFTAILNDEYINITFPKAIFSAVLVGGIIKGLAKIFAFEWITHRYDEEIDQPFDCMVYGVMLFLGFQIFESVIMLQSGTNTMADQFYRVTGLVTNLMSGFLVGFVYSSKKQFTKVPKRAFALVLGFLLIVLIQLTTRLLFVWKGMITNVTGLFILMLICLYVLQKARLLHWQSAKYYKVR